MPWLGGTYDIVYTLSRCFSLSSSLQFSVTSYLNWWGHWVFPVYWNIQIICLVQCILAFSVTCFNLFLCEVDWCIKGTSVAVARRNVLSILSTNFEEKVSISLPFRSWIGDSEENVSVKGLYFFPSFFLLVCVWVYIQIILQFHL